jgi:hypothetical protein
VGGGVAAFSAIFQMRAGTRQRFAELRWKRANAAREILQEIHAHDRACHAVTMMDWSEGKHQYPVDDEHTCEISYQDVIGALSATQTECDTATEIFIVDCFDWNFYYIGRVEHYIRSGLVDFEDVASVFRPYADKVAAHWDVYLPFMQKRQYELAIAFWRRYGAAGRRLTFPLPKPAFGALRARESAAAPPPNTGNGAAAPASR